MCECDKEIHERLAGLEIRFESFSENQEAKIKEIHKALIGNGQPGMIAEFNQWKGGAKLFSIIISTTIGVLSIIVGFLALNN